MRYSDQMIAEAEARGDANAAAYWKHVRAVVDQAPAITPALRDQLRVLLRPDAPRQSKTATVEAAAA